MRAQKIISFVYCCLLTTMALAQNKKNEYDSSWKKADVLINKNGLTQSALKEVDGIYVKAKKEKNDAQMIKALIYRINLQSNTDENSGISSIQALEKERSSLTGPARSIVASLEAMQYWNYFQNHRWELYDRTATVQFVKTDIATWSPDDFHQKIRELFLSSLHEEKLLQQTSLDNYNPVIISGNARKLRPTLYDLLAHRALDYLKSDESTEYDSGHSFSITDTTAFADAKNFAGHIFRSGDTSANPLQALYIFQKLLGFHLNDKDPSALIDVDIERIGFANQYTFTDDRTDLFRAALTVIINRYPGNPVAAQASYLLANTYAQSASGYDPLKDTANRFDLLIAKKIAEPILQEKDSSVGKANLINLLQDILQPQLQLEMEKISIPNQPSRALVSYRNITALFGRIIRLNKNEFENLGTASWDDDYWKKLTGMKVMRSFEQPLPDAMDYQLHSAEIKIDSLPVGEYIILIGTKKDFTMAGNNLAMQHLYTSNISYIQNGNDYFVLNRETGQPMQNADVQVWYSFYDNKERKVVARKGENFNTGKNGFFLLTPPKINTNSSLVFEITTQGDHLFMDNKKNQSAYYPYKQNGDNLDFEKQNLRSFLFTDRAIYRPGQPVFFKGIVVTKDRLTKKNKIVEQFRTKIFLADVNGDLVDSLNVTTNEFGSYHGSFRIPEGRLTGLFTIRDSSAVGEQSFSVEEYKRPKFYAEIDTSKQAYHLNDSITITGSAKAYAGNTVGGAKVSYRVERYPRYIFARPFAGYGTGNFQKGLPSHRSAEIANGQTVTGENGNFSIRFTAVPDITINKKTNPIFDYLITVDITDINGETRSAEKTISIGYHAVDLLFNGPETIASDSLSSLSVSATNASGEPVALYARLSIYSLKMPDRLIRERYWKQPDQFVMSEKEYHAYFPYDNYGNELDKDSWPRTDKVFETGDTIRQNTSFSLGATRLQPGWWLVQMAAKDSDGDSVTQYRYIHVYDGKTGNPGLPEYSWSFNNDQSFQPGDKASVKTGSSAANVFLIQEISRTGEPSDSSGNYQFSTISNELKTVSFSITESDRGGFGVNYVFVKNNRFYSNQNRINVPWTNKELNIGYITYRDKTLPGSAEKWTIKISGYKKDKVTAEVLSSMYDASLDQFRMQQWQRPDLFPVYYSSDKWEWRSNFSAETGLINPLANPQNYSFDYRYDELIPIQNWNRRARMAVPQVMMSKATPPRIVADDVNSLAAPLNELAARAVADTTAAMVDAGSGNINIPSTYQPRKNFNETAFFFPDLKTDSSGDIELSFTMPEALTQWKWMTLAHTKDLSLGYDERTIITQKQLMVQPNLPRFLREGDHIELVTKIVNMTDSEMTGQIGLQLLDPTTNEPVDGWFQNMQANQYFTAPAHQSVAANFTLEIPYLYNKPVTCRIMANASLGDGKGSPIALSDGEDNILPVLSNRILVTESLPLNMKGAGKKTFTFEKLLQSGNSETLKQHALTLEFTGNPAWYAVQALPYLMEYPYECAEQTFNRFYANALASNIVEKAPRIRAIFEKWKHGDTSALLSNLQKNPELKSILLEETPWVLQAKTETQQKRNIALLFDMVKMNRELSSALAKLAALANASGAFPWFSGGPNDRYITQYILTGIGRLRNLKAIPSSLTNNINQLVAPALAWLDKKMQEDYQQQLKQKSAPHSIDYFACQYLYMRSFFSAYPIPGGSFAAVNYYRKLARQSWVNQNRYMQGMIALALFRTGDIKTANDIIASLRQNAIVSNEMGMYWKENSRGYYWWQAPVETQSLLVEAFSEITKNTATVNALKTTLLKQKQTQNWPTTKATADACYALLLQGSDWLTAQPSIDIRLGDKNVSSSANTTEAGTGYFKKTFDGPFVNPGMGNITVTIIPENGSPDTPPAWGAVYWQYFENMDKISPAATPLRLSKKIFLSKNTATGPVLEPVADKASLRVGDKVIVRIELRADRDMEYIHMKDTRAGCMEPVNVISSYKWQGGLGYYESTRDASTDFFISYLPKGTYVFEYPLFVGQAGSFSNGITTIQSMYAPEFGAHSEGVHVNVEPLP